ncbi:MAG: thioredoxin family protein [Ignavibacteriales bacterium]|nr:thioredoxin family protein [Ignavibacteriales bacterium]
MNSKKLSIGDLAPPFELKGIDSKLYNLSSFMHSELLLVIFSCNHCPYVQAYEKRIIDLQNDFRDKLAVVAINSNDASRYPEDSFDEMVKRAALVGFNFPYLYDETQQTATAYGASHTPELFLFDMARKLVYTGKIDDNWQEPSKVSSTYLRNAVAELLAGNPVSVPETYAIGCTIKWKY